MSRVALAAVVLLCLAASHVVEAKSISIDGGLGDDEVVSRGKSRHGRNNSKSKGRSKTRHGKKSKGSSSSKSADDDSLGLLWKMWYTDGIKWEIRGRDWCVQCRGEHGCVPDSRIVTNHCNPNDMDQRWEFVQAGDSKGKTVQIKAKGTELCLTRMGSRNYVLQPCGGGNKRVNRRQLFVGYNKKKKGHKFTLQPYWRQERFLTMHHHPKHHNEFDGELIYDQPRHKPERTETLYWVAEYKNKVEREDLSLRPNGCWEDTQCGECEGDCESDEQCEGDLKCWQRFDGQWRIQVAYGWETPWASVPGCSGMGEFGRDYCYDPNKL